MIHSDEIKHVPVQGGQYTVLHSDEIQHVPVQGGHYTVIHSDEIKHAHYITEGTSAPFG